MLTNILASIVVSMVTNVTERVPTHWENSNQILLTTPGVMITNVNRFHTYLDPIPYGSGAQVPDPDPKQKWVRTVIKRVTTLSFDFERQHYSVDKEQIVSDNEVEYRLERTDKWTLSSTNHIK